MALPLPPQSSNTDAQAHDGGRASSSPTTRQVACPCLNIRLRFKAASDADAVGGLVQFEEDGIAMSIPVLVGRELINVPELNSSFPSPALKCLQCSTPVYAVERAALAGPTRSIGFKTGGSNSSSSTAQEASPVRTKTNSKETLIRPHNGLVLLMPGCIDEGRIREVEAEQDFSPIFGVSIPSKQREAVSSVAGGRRPSLSTTSGRHSSYGQFTATSQFGLQGLPTHLITSPPDSPANVSPSTSLSGAASWAMTASTADPIATQLETAALDRLKQWRANAEQEVLEMVRRKRKELDGMVKRARAEAEVMLDRAKSVPLAAVPRAANGLGSQDEETRTPSLLASSGRSRGASVSATEPIAADRSSSTAVAQSTPHFLDATTLSDEDFSKRPTRNVAVRPNPSMTDSATLSSSLSALSASFAMRGRDAPSEMDDWAQKRRLKERYPQGDHSVMTSAATSVANSFSETTQVVTEDEAEEDEEESRGRGRGRQRGDAKAPTTASRDTTNVGSTKVPPGTVARPTMAPSSLNASAYNKRTALTSLDTGRNSDADTPRPGGPLGGLASPSAEVHLRPRNPPPSGAEPLKPATRKSKLPAPAGQKATGSSASGTAPSEKKVAFAEVTDQAAARAPYDSEEEEKAQADEVGDSVFDIDEELDGTDEGGDAVLAASEALGKLEDEPPSTVDPDDDMAMESGIAGSLGAHRAGSFSALASSMSHQRRSGAPFATSASGFDPASLRLDGRIVDAQATSPSRSRSRNRDQSGQGRPSDYDAESRYDWSSGTAIGYRSHIADAELTLSGLLAPNAPSHRKLWTTQSKKREQKYLPDEEAEGDAAKTSPAGRSADEDWAAWQQRALQIENANIEKQRDRAAGELAHSMPFGRQGEVQPGSFVAIPTSSRRGSDATSGFDREPKTSLPYREHKMVPSLRKATRRLPALHQRRPTLPTIQDDAETDAERSARSFAGAIADNTATSPTKSSDKAAAGLLSGSVVTRGFGAGSTTEPASTASLSVARSSLGPPSAPDSPMLSLPNSPALGSSKASSPSGRRSPRPPYNPPPPPSSRTLVLKADPLQKPRPLDLFNVPVDHRYPAHEVDEEEETDYRKVLAFMHRVECLKTNKRTGWYHHRVPHPESIADHMYRMAMLAMLCPKTAQIDIGKCVMLALVHDLAEAEVGDLTPLDGVPKEEKTRREAEALAYLVHDLLGSSPAALRIEELWLEYEHRTTLEARLVKDLDRFELLLQAVEYEERYDIRDLQPFFSCAGDITHPRIRRWTEELEKERSQLWGYEPRRGQE